MHNLLFWKEREREGGRTGRQTNRPKVLIAIVIRVDLK